MTSTHITDAQARRSAKRIGWRLEKSRTRNLHLNDHGLYQLIDDRNTVIGGSDYDASLEDAAYWIKKEVDRLTT